MIHYHGTPLTPKAQLEKMAGRHFCVRYREHDDLKTCLRIASSIMFDNGAFSAFTLKQQFDEPGFYRWLEPILSHPHWAVIPDVIDGDETDNDLMLSRWPHGRQLGAPVWHLHESVDRLLDLADYWPRICLGSSGEFWQVGDAKWCSRMDETFNALVSRRNAVPWIHGLRMLGQIDGDWPLASADSTNVAQNWKRNTGCAECMAAGIDSVQTPGRWIKRAIQTGLEL